MSPSYCCYAYQALHSDSAVLEYFLKRVFDLRQKHTKTAFHDSCQLLIIIHSVQQLKLFPAHFLMFLLDWKWEQE